MWRMLFSVLECNSFSILSNKHSSQMTFQRFWRELVISVCTLWTDTCCDNFFFLNYLYDLNWSNIEVGMRNYGFKMHMLPQLCKLIEFYWSQWHCTKSFIFGVQVLFLNHFPLLFLELSISFSSIFIFFDSFSSV